MSDKKKETVQKLSNGLTFVFAPRTDATTATILILVAAGSLYEKKEESGISHFLEHMCFKGTKKRPRSLDISAALDALGAEYNAFTSQEYTGYYAKVDPSHIYDAIDIVSDIYINQVYRPEEIKREAGVIIEEINMYEDDPRRKIHDNFTALLYGDQPAGWNIAGTKRTVRRINKEMLEQYHRRHYVSGSTVVVVSGNFDYKKTKDIAYAAFKGIRSGKRKRHPVTKENQKKPRIAGEYRKTDQTHMMIGFRAFPLQDPRASALKVLSVILGGGMSSRLFCKIREEMGAAYYVGASASLQVDHGYMAISVGAANKKAFEVLEVILAECRRLLTEKVGEEELKKAKDYMKGRFLLGLETTDELGWFYGNEQLLRGTIRTPEQIVKEIFSVKPQDIMKVARDIFVPPRLNIAYIGPFKDKKEFVSRLVI